MTDSSPGSGAGVGLLTRLVQAGLVAVSDGVGLAAELGDCDEEGVASAVVARGFVAPSQLATIAAEPRSRGEDDGRAARLRSAVTVDADALTVALGDRGPRGGVALTRPSGSARYAMGTELARGGQGSIRLARDADLGRTIAVKTLHPDRLASPDAVRRFVREAQLTGQLEHPGIVPIHDIGELGSEGPFYAMRLVQGSDLAAVLDKLRAGDPAALQRYTVMRLVGILQRVAHAVGFAHDHGVVHRDLKPANIMVGEHDEVYVMDWGIAKVCGDASRPPGPAAEEDSIDGMTKEGTFVGTPMYVSPEQAHGESLGPPSDVFSLGIMLYECLALARPFDAPSMPGVLMSVILDEPAPLQRAAPHGNVSATLEEICFQALRKEPSERYPDGSAFADALLAEMEGDNERRHRAQLTATEGAKARELLERHDRLSQERARLAADLARDATPNALWLPPQERHKAATRRALLDQMDLAVAKAFSDATHQLATTLRLDPDDQAVRSELAKLFRHKYSVVARSLRMDDIVYFGARMDECAALASAGRRQDGTMTLHTIPTGAELSLVPYEAVGDGALSWREHRIGHSPVLARPVAPGGHVIIARLAGHADRILPVFFEAGEQWRYVLGLFPLSTATPMVGRRTALGALISAVDGILGHGGQAIATVQGPEGAGKTRLLKELDGYADDLPVYVAVVEIRCRAQSQHVPLAALRAILRQRLRAVEESPHLSLAERLRRHVSVFVDCARADREHVGPGSAAGPEADPVAMQKAAAVLLRVAGLLPPEGSDLPTRQETTEAFISYFRHLARLIPVVLYLASAEHLDEASAHVLHALLAETRDERIMLVLSIEESYSSQAPAASLLSAALATGRRLGLAALEDDEIRTLLQELLGASVDESVIAPIADCTGGLPGRIANVVRVAARVGWLVQEAGCWRFADGTDRGLLRAESVASHWIAGLPPSAQRVLSAGALVGERFGPPALRALGVGEIDEGLALLASDEIILPADDKPGAFEFGDAMLRAAARELVPSSQQRDMHARLATWYAQREQRHEGVAAAASFHAEQAGLRDEAANWAAAMALDCDGWGADEDAAWWRARAEQLRD